VGAFLPRIQWCCLIDVQREIILLTISGKFAKLQLAMSQPMGEVVQCLVTGLGSLILALYFSWNLTLAIVCTVPSATSLWPAYPLAWNPNVHKQGEKLQEALKYVPSAFPNIEMVKSFNGQDSELWRYCGAIRGAPTYYIRQANLPSLQMGFMQLARLGCLYKDSGMEVRLLILERKIQVRSDNVLGSTPGSSIHHRVSSSDYNS